MNWPKLISELRANGETQSSIAAACDCGQSTISDILRGTIKCPAYRIGKAIIDLHAKKLAPGETAMKEAA